MYGDHFRGGLLNPKAWLERAEELSQAAALLEPSVLAWWSAVTPSRQSESLPPPPFSFHGVYLMLQAYALENQCKVRLLGTMTPRELATRQSTFALPRRLQTHNLVLLFRALHQSTERREEQVLRQLSRCSVWAGRYPVPLEAMDLFPERHSDGRLYDMRTFLEDDVPISKALLLRIASLPLPPPGPPA